ncbi:MAG: ECF transporter S component [Candidatus Delongbacteria bacterium]|nr:ECF transporter S component [Candidatus Delongbacteria bacterium]
MKTANFELKLDAKNISIMVILMALPNVLGLININLIGFKLHFFQYAIFLAAMMYGSTGGLLAGGIGSLYSAIAMSNPYIVLFNALLGFLFGKFYKGNEFSALAKTLAVQLPLIILIDYFIIGMPVKVLTYLVIGLLVTDFIWVFGAKKTKEML